MKTVTTILVLACVPLMAGTPAFSQVCLSEPFYYPDGNLEGNGSWSLIAGAAGQIVVSNNTAKLLFNNDTTIDNLDSVESWDGLGCVNCGADGKVTATFKIRRNSATTGDGIAWWIRFHEPTGKDMGGFYGTPTAATPRMAGKVLTPSATLTADQFDELKIVFDMAARTTSFYRTPSGGSEVGVGSPNVIVWDIDVAEPARPPSGTTTISKVQIINWNKNEIYGGDMTIDDLEIVRCPGSCLMQVTPLASAFITEDFLSVAEAGGVGFPSLFTFTLENQSEVIPINFTASEVKADGSPTDYSWLSLAPTSGGPIAPAETAQVVASLTPGASPGIYSGNIEIADDCDPSNHRVRPVVLVVGDAPWFIDPFQYPAGNLPGNGGWIGSGTLITADPDDPNNQVAKVELLPNTSGTTAISGLSCPPCEDGKLVVIAKIKGSATGIGATGAWQLDFVDAAGNALATWEGDYSRARGRTALTNTPELVTPYATVTSTQFHELKAEIDVKNNRTTYYSDGNPLGTTGTHGTEVAAYRTNVGDRVDGITIYRRSRDPLGGYVLFDDLRVFSCPGVCSGRVSSGVSEVGYTDSPHAILGDPTPTRSDGVTPYGPKAYTFHNDAPQTMSYTVTEVAADGVTPFDYSWMSLNKTGGGPVLGGTADAPVEISYNTSGLAKGLYRGFVKFTDTCSSARSYVRSIQLNVGDCITEDFGYPDGNLESMPGWRTGSLNQQELVPQMPGGTSPFPIEVVSGTVRVHGAPAPGTVEATHQPFEHCPACPDYDTQTPGVQGDGLIVVRAKIRGTADGGGARFWGLSFAAYNGTDLASWGGAAEFAEAAGDPDMSRSLADGAVHELKAYINVNTIDVDTVPADSTMYFFDGSLVGVGFHSNPGLDRVRLIRIRRNDNAVSDPNPVVEIDDISISACGPMCGDPVFDVRDVNGNPAHDQKVSVQDYIALSECWTGPGIMDPSPTPECQCLDATGDGAIDMQDFALFQTCYTGDEGGPADPGCDND